MDRIRTFDEVCANCGSHHGGSSTYPYNYCPGHEGKMDWGQGKGTSFKSHEPRKYPELRKYKEE